MKLLLTGDLHLGRSYQKESPEVAQRFTEARMTALENAVTIANREQCDFFVIAGDLYDKVSSIPKSLHQKVNKVLDEFDGQAVLILPGNHDYCDLEHDELWRAFEESSGSHTRVLKECAPCEIAGTMFYPCLCHDKRSKENALGWLKGTSGLSPDLIHIGIAHGAVEGYSLDADQSYYFMTEKELHTLGMDIWLIGHTHVEFSIGNHIFNAGTPQQTDIADSSDSEVYLIEIDEQKNITAKKEKVGVIDFVKKEVTVEHHQRLEDVLQFPELEPDKTSVRVVLTGMVLPEEYEDRQRIYETCGAGFIKFDVKDENLQKAITPELIGQETMEGSTLHRLLNSYADDMELLNLAYSLAQECRND